MVSYSCCCPFTHYYVYSFPQIRPNGVCVASAALCALVPLAAVCAGRGIWSSGLWWHVCVWHDGADAVASSYCEHDFVECPLSVKKRSFLLLKINLSLVSLHTDLKMLLQPQITCQHTFLINKYIIPLEVTVSALTPLKVTVSALSLGSPFFYSVNIK